MSSLTQKITSFAFETKFDDLPKSVVNETKRILMDSIGCGLAGISCDKGKTSIKLAQRLAGPEESSIIGTSARVSCHGAAFANGELINALDYDAVLTPPTHVSPYVIPAPLAFAESIGASGKDLILATALGHEIATRVSRGIDSVKPAKFSVRKESGDWSPSPGFGQCIFGGAAAAGKILKLNQKQMSNALGIAGHYTPVPTIGKFESTVPSAMTKFGSTGWLSSAEVVATLLAQNGYVGDDTVLDGEQGVWRYFGCTTWNPEAILEKIGETWFLLNTKYKMFPCCGLYHTALDCFTNIIEKNKLSSDDIESVRVFGHSRLEKPQWRSTKLVTHVDAQFSCPYVFSVAAHRIKIGAEWQDPATMKNTDILKFMKKVKGFTHPGFTEALGKDPRSSIGMVEVIAKGKTFKEERMHYRGTPFTEAQASDDDLVGKFRQNAAGILTKEKTDKAVKVLMGLETVKNIKQLIEQVTL